MCLCACVRTNLPACMRACVRACVYVFLCVCIFKVYSRDHDKYVRACTFIK